MTRRITLIALLICLSGCLGVFCASAREPQGSKTEVSIDKEFTGDGAYAFHISERGVGPTGKFRRAFVFEADLKRGVAVPNEFRNYKAIMTTERAGVWTTERVPIAGYIFLFFKGQKPQIELQLLESWDGHPTRMTVNGVYQLQIR